jgi:diguanylate cyclase (GGDEF)-like protein
MDQRQPQNQSKILLISDDAVVRKVVASELPSSLFEVRSAGSKDEGIRAVSEQQIDLILLDANGEAADPGGLCQLTALSDGAVTPPVVLLASEADLEVVQRGLHGDVLDVITKPLADSFLVERLQYLLKNSRRASAQANAIRRMRAAQTIAQIGDWQWTPETGELECSEEAGLILNLDGNGDTETLQDVLLQVHPEDRERLSLWFDEISEGRHESPIEHRIIRTDGNERLVVQHAMCLQESNGRPQQLAIVVNDVTERRQAEVENQYHASHDSVTGLQNYESFLDRIKEASWTAERSGERFAVFYLGVAKFARIHESLGHRFGDIVLAKIGERLKMGLRCTDFISLVDESGSQTSFARIHGANFAILLQSVGRVDEVARLASRINELFTAPIVHGGQEFYFVTNIGVALSPDDSQDAEDLLRLSQTAMNRCSGEGRTKVQFATPKMNQETLELMSLEASLRRGVQLEQFEAHYQPKIDVGQGRIVGMEALVRWREPGVGIVAPGRFISVAEESGLIVPIGEWMLRESCRQAKAWQDAGIEPIPIAVNVSVEQFRRADIVKVVADALEESGLDPEWLEIELTESAVMENTEENIVVLRRLKSLGVLLSIDDFGTGYSSLSYLRQFPIDILKIDRSFVEDLPDDPDAAAIVTTIVHMSRGLGLKLIAEGVETEAQLDFLGMLGCDQYQGYLYSRPLPAEEATALLESPAMSEKTALSGVAKEQRTHRRAG